MSHFYASIPVSSRKTVATAEGSAKSGIASTVQSYKGSLGVSLHDANGTTLATIAVATGSTAFPRKVIWQGPLQHLLELSGIFGQGEN